MPEPITPKRGTRKRWLILGTIFLAASSGAIFFRVTQYRDVPLRISEETTLITEPLKSNGLIDYLKAFEELSYSDKIASTENGFRQIVQKVRWSQKLDDRSLEQLRSKLGLEAKPVQPSLKYVEPYDVAAAYFKSPEYDVELIRSLELSQGDMADQPAIGKKKYLDFDVTDVIDSRVRQPWTEKDLPMMAQWVREQSPVLDIYLEAVKAPIFEMPLIDPGDDESLLYADIYSGEFRAVARGFVARANYFLGLGDVDRAMEDILACKRLGRHVRNRNTMLDRLIGVAIEGTSDSVGVLSSENNPATKKQLEYIVQELQTLPALNSIELAALHEKYIFLDALQLISRNPEFDIFGTDHKLKEFKELGIDWNIAARQYNSLFDSHFLNDDYSLDESKYSPMAMRWSRKIRSQAIGEFVFWGTTPPTVFEAERRTRCADNLRLIALGMLNYEKEHGTLPPAHTVDKNGKRLHSWRVLILPYVGHQKLFDQIKLNEPWDSEHNSKLFAKCPELFRCPSCKGCQDSDTSFSVVVGPDTAFGGSKGKSLASFGPHSDDLILVAERTTPIHWMDPTQEITQADAEKGINRDAEKDGHSSIGSQHPGGAQVATRNGANLFLSDSMETRILQALLRGENTLFMDF